MWIMSCNPQKKSLKYKCQITCTPKTNTILYVNCTLINNKQRKKYNFCPWGMDSGTVKCKKAKTTTTNPWEKCFHHPQFTDEEVKALRS